MFRVAEINFGQSVADQNYSFQFNNKTFEVQTFTAGFSVSYTKDLIRSLRSQVDAIALTSLPVHFRVQNRSYVHPATLEILNFPTSIPLCDGHMLRELSVVGGLQNLIDEKRLRPEHGIFIPSGILNYEATRFLRKHKGSKVGVGDVATLLGLPVVIPPHSMAQRIAVLIGYYGSTRNVRHFSPLNKNFLRKLSAGSLPHLSKPYRYVFTGPQFLSTLGRDLELIRNKTLIFPYLPPSLREQFKTFAPEEIIDLFPQQLLFHECMTYSVADAVLRLDQQKTAALSMREWADLLEMKDAFQAESREYLFGSRRSKQSAFATKIKNVQRLRKTPFKPDFAFVIHALSKKDFVHLPGFRWLEDSPKFLLDGIERTAARAPGFVYGKIENIVSKKTGKPVSGIIYALPMTPAMLRQESPEIVYKKIERLSQDAADRGAKLMGLGAYTKVIGDQGVTIHEMSPIPVTTGNSLSASATLWALHAAAKKMNVNPKTATAMVIGATGSIGSVSAKLLALVFDRLVLVAPRMERLQELKNEIKALRPDCHIVLATAADEAASQADAIVTATSAFDQKIVSVEGLKPGAIVCDCSRPLDFTNEDAMKRPDILIIESGEVILPGAIKMTCDLGLPKNVFYACFAETAVLAMEQRHEPFTLGRDIHWEKVREIYRLSRAHGVELAAIRGHAGIISDREIELVKTHARRTNESILL